MKHLWVGLVLVASCGAPEFEILMNRQNQYGQTWVCPDGSQFTIDTRDPPDYQGARGCYGIDSDCPGSGDPLPDDARCADTSYNIFKSTCVDTFFASFDPGGTCTKTGSGQDWSNGARFEGSVENGALFNSNGTLVGIIERASGPIEYRYARPIE